jgi:hypothetical protein
MPNQRHKDKKFVGTWLKAPLYRAVRKTAKNQNVSVSQWVTEQLTAAANSTDPVARLADEIVSDALVRVAAPVPKAPKPAAATSRSTQKVRRRTNVKPGAKTP